ncbi:cuticle protein 21-like [Leptopilina heterotoma]|uniref:cuticle protein 21-like n=1 Tax=Leptopilina heterotoma TaxID=63436 RepID=UPI001CA988BA|nr:cuticle protein 21-like [Leptopilina heterotoma]
MAFKFVVLAALVAVSQAGFIGAPLGYAAAPVAKLAVAPVASVVKTVDADYDPNPQYSYAYDVQDALTGDSKSQHETRNGDIVQGSYSLLESDGTRRTVDYTADSVNGFNAVVHKEPAEIALKTAVAPVAVAAPVIKTVAPVVKTVAPAYTAAYAAAPVAQYAAAAPVAHYAAPVAQYAAAAPVAHYAAPVAQYHAAPVAHYTAPVAQYAAAPVAHYAAPVAQYAAAPVAHYAAPVAQYAAAAPVAHYATAPVAQYAAAPVAHIAKVASYAAPAYYH